MMIEQANRDYLPEIWGLVKPHLPSILDGFCAGVGRLDALKRHRGVRLFIV